MWSDELAHVAQPFSEKCVFAHNPDRTSQQNIFPYVGENIAATTIESVDYSNLVMNWYNEVMNYNYSSGTCSPSRVCGHYTQVGVPTINSSIIIELYSSFLGSMGIITKFGVRCLQMW